MPVFLFAFIYVRRKQECTIIHCAEIELNQLFILFQATTKLKEHEPCGYAYKVVLSEEFAADYDSEVVVHRDSGHGNVAESFITSLYEEAERLAPILESKEEMEDLTPEQQQAHDAATVCWLCLEPFVVGDEEKKKCRDHCHYKWV